MALLDDFKARFPGYDTATADTYVPIMEDARLAYFAEDYSADNKELVLNLVAHLVTVEARASDSAERLEASRTVGSVSQSFQAGTASNPLNEFFSSTRYGQVYLRLLRHRGGGVFV